MLPLRALPINYTDTPLIVQFGEFVPLKLSLTSLPMVAAYCRFGAATARATPVLGD